MTDYFFKALTVITTIAIVFVSSTLSSNHERDEKITDNKICITEMKTDIKYIRRAIEQLLPK